MFTNAWLFARTPQHKALHIYSFIILHNTLKIWVGGGFCYVAICGGSSVFPEAQQSIILDLSFPQCCSGSEEFIHTDLTRVEHNVLEGKPFLLVFSGGTSVVWRQKWLSIREKHSLLGKHIYSENLKAASWCVCQGILFSGQRRKWFLGEDPPGAPSSLGIDHRCRKCQLSDQAVVSLLF